MFTVNREKDLADIRNYLYEEAEKLWRWSLYVSASVQVLSLIAAFTNSSWFLVIVGLLALTAPISITWLREQANQRTQKADKCRRLILYADGLGERIQQEELANVFSWVNVKPKPAPFISPYYDSNFPVGTNRLADITSESAFFTKAIAEKVKFYLQIFLFISSLLIIIILYLAATTGKAGIIINTSKVTTSIISFLLAGDIFILMARYSELSAVAKETFLLCSKLKGRQDLKVSEVMQTTEDYHITLIQSPPIPFIFYQKYQKSLNDAYKKSQQNF